MKKMKDETAGDHWFAAGTGFFLFIIDVSCTNEDNTQYYSGILRNFSTRRIIGICTCRRPLFRDSDRGNAINLGRGCKVLCIDIACSRCN